MHDLKGIYAVLHIDGDAVSVVGFYESPLRAMMRLPPDNKTVIYDVIGRDIIYEADFKSPYRYCWSAVLTDNGNVSKIRKYL